MAAQSAALWTLSIDTSTTSTPVFSPVAGLRTRSFKVNSSNIDGTTASSTLLNAGQGVVWKEIVEQTGVLSIEIDAAGLYQKDANTHTLLSIAQSGASKKMQLIANGITVIGAFVVDSYESSGAYNDVHQFNVKLASTGAVTITSTTA